MKLRDVLLALGFEEPEGRSDLLRFDFGNLELNAGEEFSLAGYVIHFWGGEVSPRTACFHDFKLPVEVTSFEQGVAFLAYYLRSFKPLRPVPWLAQGREWEDSLPWVRDRKKAEQRQKEYERCPKCYVERPWLKLAVTELLELAASATDDDLAHVSFDGEILRIVARDRAVALGAHGKPWERSYCIRLQELQALPKRVTQRMLTVSVWQGRIQFAGRSWPLVELPAEGRDPLKKVAPPSTN
jgi:hypothetical protein